MLSNTRFFEEHRQWRGGLIEPHPLWFAQLRRGRTCAPPLRVAVCARAQTLHFVLNGALSGLLELMPPREQSAARRHKSVPVQCQGLDRTLEELAVPHIDFMSLDVEGAELEVLHSVDWAAVTVDVMVVEIEHQPYEVIRAIRKLLADHGYVSRGLCCGAYADEIFQNLHYPHDRFPRKYVAPAGYRPFDASRGQFRLKPCSSVPPAMKQRLDHREKTEQTGQGYATYVNEIATDCPKDKAKSKAFGPY